jgi:phytoene dehydrogenase-like protein
VTETAVVVGGGLAGIAAALRLADAGRQVVLLESRPRLGGAAFSFSRGELSIDNGQHVFLRCCDSYRWLLQRLGAEDQIVLQRRLDIPVLRGARRSVARRPRCTRPAATRSG